MPVFQTPPIDQPINAAPGAGAYSPYTAPPTAVPPPPYAPNASVSPGLAFILGLIPGVGAIYNGQYAKGLIHVLVLGTLMSLASSGNLGPAAPLFGLLIAAWFFYMAFEAYHTAKRRQLGQPVDEFSSVFPMRGAGRFPVGPIIMIAVGLIFLLNNLNWIHFYDIARYWPVFLIALGGYMLYSRVTAPVESETLPGAQR
jgi:TM2 domain-containing membrane protein YozV